MLCKNPKEPLDGAPFVTGCLTFLRQFHSNHTEECLTLLGQYIRSMVDAQHTGKWVMTSCYVIDDVIIGRSQLTYPVMLSMCCFSWKSLSITVICLGRWGPHPLVNTIGNLVRDLDKFPESHPSYCDHVIHLQVVEQHVPSYIFDEFRHHLQ